MYETNVTAVGRVATTITSRRFGDGGRKASFRMACNERRRDWNAGGKWVDGDTLYMTVNCWRSLAENVEASLSLGDPVVVRGRMSTRHFEAEGHKGSVVEIDATAVGPDLARCTASITRTPRTAPAEVEGSAAGGGWQPGPLVAPSERTLVAVGGGGGSPGEAAVRG